VRIIAPEDTVYVDLGPVFAEWEADIGRTYALGSDPAKRKPVDDLPRVFKRVQRYYYAGSRRRTLRLRKAQQMTRAGHSAALSGPRFRRVRPCHDPGRQGPQSYRPE
jgi:hypothetical protein